MPRVQPPAPPEAAEYLRTLQNKEMPTGGLELDAKTTGKTVNPKADGAESGAQAATGKQMKPVATTGNSHKLSANPLHSVDPQLQQLTNAWPTLPKAIRQGILAMIEAAKE